MTVSTLFNRFNRPTQAPLDAPVKDEKNDVEAPVVNPIDEKEVNTKVTNDQTDREKIDAADYTPGAQEGVKKAEATTTVWTKGTLYMAYVMIWIIYFVDTMQQNTTNVLTPYVTSSFSLHSTIAATGIVSGIVGGLIKLPLAKILDIWGRPQGYFLMVCCLTLGLIMMAGCNNVKTYAAAQVFYWVGYNGLTYTLGIFIADTSKLRNRAFMFAYASSPYLATTWVGGPIGNAFLKGPGWRWAFGAWSIITPCVTLPLAVVFYINYNKAEKMGLIQRTPSGRTMAQSIKHYFVEFDIIGLFLICAGLALFLLPFSLYSYQKDQWRSAMIIAMIVVGGLLIIAFAVWERYFAPVTFIPYDLLADRTVFWACILSGSLFIEYYLWASYFFSFNQVVMGLTVTEASYVGNTYSMGSCFFSLIVGLLIRYTGRFKWIALWFGVPVTILGCGLMIHFRQPDTNVGYIVMCQIFIAIAGGTLVICEQTAAMAATSHQFVAVVLAIEGCFSSIGGAIGLAIAGAIWTGVFPKKLYEYLPENAKADFPTIYGDMTVQMSYPFGSPERDAINKAYGEAQKCMCIAATAVLAIAWFSVAMWRDINVKTFKQVKGVVL